MEPRLAWSSPTFTHSKGGTSPYGANPYVSLEQGTDGNFYGTTYGLPSGGLGGDGRSTVFEISTNGAFTSLYFFTDGNDGYRPSGLVQGNNGSFCGTTSSGGQGGRGTIFRLTIVPDPPQLTITPSGANVILTWPTNFAGYTLEFATNLVSPIAWNANLTVLTGQGVIGGQNVVTNPITGSQMFYRLANAPNFGANWVAPEWAMKVAGAISYGHQSTYVTGPFVTEDMFYLPVPTSVIELANANPTLWYVNASSSSGPSPGHGCPEHWEGWVGLQSVGSVVIALPGSATGGMCYDSIGLYQGF